MSYVSNLLDGIGRGQVGAITVATAFVLGLYLLWRAFKNYRASGPVSRWRRLGPAIQLLVGAYLVIVPTLSQITMTQNNPPSDMSMSSVPGF